MLVTAANTGALSTEEIDANQLQVDSAINSIQRIANATVRIFSGVKEISLSQTDTTGGFIFILDEGNYTVQVYSGSSYLPAILNVNSFLIDANVTLNPGAIVEFTGDLQFIDSENLPLDTVIHVLNEDGESVSHSGFQLVYGTAVSGSMKIPFLEDNMALIPADQPVIISMNSSLLVGNSVENRHLLINVSSQNTGSPHQIDLRQYTIPLNQLLAAESQGTLEGLLEELNSYGFYLAKQETDLSSGKSFITQSKSLYAEGSYGDSFEALKKGYLVFQNTITELNQMYLDASFSIFILITFLGISSLVLGYLVSENLTTQVLSNVAIYFTALSVFYASYPGSRIVTPQYFAISSIGILALLMTLGRIFSSLFYVGSGDRRVHTRNLVLPIFSLAKRSLRRRRLRFLLTLVSLTLLVTSFVTLTSFTQGYGVVSGRSQPNQYWEGVFIRDGGWTQNEPTFLTQEPIEINWLVSQPEVNEIYLKAENIPLRRPYISLSGMPIFGVIGGDEIEYNVIGLESILDSGTLPNDGVVVSNSVLESTGLMIGNQIQVGSTYLTIVGTFDDVELNRLRDLDDSPYVSNKWVNTNPDGEIPVWVLDEVDPGEQLFVSLETANTLSLVGVQRIGMSLNPGESTEDFAESLALERGFISYSSTSESFTRFKLGNYFESKGLSLMIPWIIVVLNVVITMLNSLFERRKEIEILSAIGLNPAQVSAIFVVEATITGFIAGGLGYLIGLSFYKALAYLNIGLQVHQKVSAVWSIASIALAISAVLTGAYAALRNSVVITPSLMRRWKMDSTTGGFD
jgi:hypothetical protein